MNSCDSEERNIFIASEDFILKENDQLHLFKYYDPLNDNYITFVSQSSVFDGEIYIGIKQDNVKSAFIGNTVLPAPVVLYVKRYNPLIVIIGLIALTMKHGGRMNGEIDYATIINVYTEEVKKGKRINENECISFVRNVLYNNVDLLDLICEVKRNDVFDDISFKFRLLKSKVYDFLNSKIDIDAKSKTSHLINSNVNEKEKEEITNKMIKERFEVLLKFMPRELMIEYANDKNIKISNASVLQEDKKAKMNIKETQEKSNEHEHDNEHNKGKRKVDTSLLDVDGTSINYNNNSNVNGNDDCNMDESKQIKRKPNMSITDLLINPSNEQKKKKVNKKQASQVNIDQGNLNSFFTQK